MLHFVENKNCPLLHVPDFANAAPVQNTLTHIHIKRTISIVNKPVRANLIDKIPISIVNLYCIIFMIFSQGKNKSAKSGFEFMGGNRDDFNSPLGAGWIAKQRGGLQYKNKGL